MPLEFMKPFFQWSDATMLGEWVRGGTWEFPIIETIHILSLAMLYGATALLSLRMMGLLMRGWTVAGVAREVRPYVNASLVVILTSGTLLYLSEAMKAYENAAFWVKVYLLIAALLFHFFVVNPAARASEVPKAKGMIIGAVSLLLWWGIGIAGRAIGFV